MSKDHQIILYLGDDEIPLPTKWEICGHCEGEGTSSAYLGVFTRDDMDEMDDEWKEDYCAGRFDRACEHCSGGKVKVADWDRMPPEHQDAYRAQLEEEHQTRQTERMERRMEGGWREEWQDY